MIKLICNPHANRGRGKSLITQMAHELNVPLEDVAITSSIRDAEYQACMAAKNNYSSVVCAGGDGILNAVINGILPVRDDVKVGFIPIGMNNVAALSAGIPMDISSACGVVKAGFTRKIDIGSITSSGGELRYFFTMADCGLTAQAVFGGESNMLFKRTCGRMAILGSGFYYYFKEKAVPMEINLDGRIEKAYLIIAVNGSYYGGNFKVADADMYDGKLDLCLFTGGCRRDLWRYFRAFVNGKLADFDDILHFKVRNVTVDSPKPVRSQIDGEPLGHTPCKIDIMQSRLSVFLPKNNQGTAPACVPQAL